MTGFHARYAGTGVMIYWHVEEGPVCVYSQLKQCSFSEVAAVIEGLLGHCTDAQIEANYTRHPRHERRRVPFHRTARVPAVAPAEEHRRHPPALPRRGARGLAEAAAHHQEPPDHPIGRVTDGRSDTWP